MIGHNNILIHPHALKDSPRHWLKTVTEAVQHCDHGHACTKCCHLFTRTDLLYTKANLLRRNPDVIQSWSQWVLLPMFFWELTYGPQRVRPNRARIIQRCAEPLCVNLFHLYRGRRSAESDFWSLVRTCEHGHMCLECCWPWRGRLQKQMSGSRSVVGYFDFQLPDWSRRNPAPSYKVAYYYTYGRYPDRRAVVSQHICDSDGSCCNPHHLRFISTFVMRSETTLRWQARRRNARYMLEAA